LEICCDFRGVTIMTETAVSFCCPHLGLDVDQTVMLDEPALEHRCYGQRPPLAPDAIHQQNYCLSSAYATCSFYAPPSRQTIQPDSTLSTPSLPVRQEQRPLKGGGKAGRSNWLQVLTLLSIGMTVCLILIYTFSDLLGFRPLVALPIQSSDHSGTANLSLSPTAIDAGSTPVLVAAAPITSTPTPTASPTLTANATPTAAIVRFVTPTAEPGGQVFLLGSSAGNAGWWKDEDNRRNHLGDSYLYAGVYGGETFISAIRIDLTRVPRGAPIREAQLRLTGLRQDQFQSDAEGIWLVQLVPESSLENLGPADFLTMLSAPAALTLFPPLTVTDLAPDRVNQWEFDETTRQWLEKQLLDGATSVILRIQASISRGEALFAWDSGLGPETKGNSPGLLLSLGPPPPTPPPLPTKPVIVATLTPVPKDVLTVVAIAQTATAVALTTGTYTPVPYAIVTPTPFPANLETVQAVAFAQELPPVVLHTPAPANPVIATRNADYATAVALTTGTFTPVPTDYVTPMLIPPSPPAENVATEAARVVAATALANSGASTPTPLPYNAVIAVYVYATATPGDSATAAAEAVIATASAKVNGTSTPLPWNALVITRIPPTEPPTATPLPLLQSVAEFTPTPTPTDSQSVPNVLPAYLSNKILFKTNRNGPEEVYALDPTNGELYRINESWVYPLAQQQLNSSPDGKRRAIVKADSNRILQIHITSPEYQSTRQITALTGEDIGRSAINYDPAWSPTSDLIAFVSTNSGNDEIYTVTADGSILTQLTVNSYEWDKHPSWSPDGSQIVFFSNRETGRRQLWIMNADGTGQRNLSNNAYEDWEPIWIR